MKSSVITKNDKPVLEPLRTTVGVYQSHKDAINAVIALEKAGIPIQNISFISTAVVVADNMQTHTLDSVKNAPVAIGAVLGPLLGILAGASIWAVPGLGFVYGAGAIVGAIAGFDVGLVTGGLGTLLMTLGIKKEKVLTYHKHLQEGKYLVVLNGNKTMVQKAKKIVHHLGNYIELVIM